MVNLSLNDIWGDKGRAAPWRAIASIIVDGEASEKAPPTGRSWIEEVADATQYPPAYIRRLRLSEIFLRLLEKDGHEAVGAVSNWPFSHIDNIRKIYEVDPARGLKLLSTSETSPFNQRELEKLLKDLRARKSPIAKLGSGGRIRSAQFSEKCLTAIHNSKYSFGLKNNDDAAVKYYIRRWGNSTKWASPEFFVTWPNERRIDAVDCYGGLHCQRMDIINEKIKNAVFESTFFDVFWIIIPIREELEYFFKQAINDLGMANIGILGLDDFNLEIITLEGPRAVHPVPDRRGVWEIQRQAMFEMLSSD
ncbi:MAG TPA: hypothetical protein ENH55_13850 [Aurantimonas coralicida]|uniref:Uncharacterized protein n=2 Tax=root TaxID=1 RepID=A0A9C9TGZ4_9HYPH|nr:hypothetical protein [Aurantimonas coralicida]HEU00975.1 hypothetical protein [Aurantimonas coralicida]